MNYKSYLDYLWFMKKTWMNIRRPLIKQAGIKDRSYDEDMLKLEDKDKMLDEDFKISDSFARYTIHLLKNTL